MDMNNIDAESVLGQWRTKILNGFLVIAAIAAGAMVVANIADAISRPGQWPAVIVFLILELVLAALAIFRKIAYRIRAWGVLLIPYAVGVTALATYGLGSSGRLYLLVLPIGALVLMGVQSGIIMSVLSLLTMAVFAFLAERGILMKSLIADRNSLLLVDWLAEFTDTAMLLVVVMALLIMFYRFQERLIAQERRAQAELRRTHEMLEEQNVSLEQKVKDRTAELQASNLSLEQRNAELAIINSLQEALASRLDLQAVFELIGEKVCEVFNVQVVDLVTYDKATNLISMPYSYEKGDRSVISPREPYGFRLHVINSGEPFLINRNFAGLASQYDNPILTGACPKSVLFMPFLVEGDVRGIISIQDLDREDAFNDSDVRLLQTLANAMSVAIENARLFDELKRQKEYAQEAQRRLADIINFLPDATLVIDRQGKVIAWNHAVEEMTGVPAQAMLEKSDYEYAMPFYAERRPILIDLVGLPQEEIEKKYVHIQRSGGVLTGETYTPALRGGARYLYATAAALHDAKGNMVGAIESIRDITDRKHTEEELKKARASAEQANQAKSAFLANMSHELRTPLNAIIGFTRIVRRKSEGLLPEKQTENLDKVLTSAEHLLNLINTVLDIAKIEAGRMDVLAANFRMGALMDLCANTAQPLLKPNVILEKQIDERLNIVHSDQDKIRQIILNLLSNAAKFTHEGKIILAARQDGENLRVSVNDTGIGISAEALPRIFKEFQQADASTTRQYGGTGLGLSISRNLARLLGGDLNVESELGKGSTFTLVIPIQFGSRPADLHTDHEPVSVQATVSLPEPGSAKKRILVIDDDPDAVYLLQENLNPQEFEIIGARNGQDGLRLAREVKLQAILLDVVMPGTDGWQVLHDLKASPATSNIPVVFLTIVDKKALGLQLGAAAYLLKPLDPLEVRATLHRVIGDTGHPPKRVLVVDDDPAIVDMLRQCLPESDFSLDSAPDGLAGLQAVEANRPDILLLDLVMPHLDGFGVIERLRTNPQMRDLPIIVISAKDLTASESARLKEAVTIVMKKQGFEGEKLVDEINNVLKQERLPA